MGYDENKLKEELQYDNFNLLRTYNVFNMKANKLD